MAERCVNLTAAEARAWAAGATALIRPAKIASTNPDYCVHVTWPKWQPGDVLIGREAWRIDIERGAEWVVYLADGARRIKPAKAAVNLYLPASSARMPKDLARFRHRVVSVRVCRWQDVTRYERRQTKLDDFGPLRCGADTWVSVTMTEAADVR